MFKRIRMILAVMIVLMASQSCVYAETQPQLGNQGQIEQWVLDTMDKGKVPGVSIVIVKNGQTVMNKGFGYADKESKRAVTKDTAFQLGSLSKSFTGLAITHLANEHRLKLDEAVSSYLPWFHVTYQNVPREITIHQLMEHSSGLGTQTFIDIPASADKDALESGVKTVINAPLSSVPGEKYAYSNANFNILGLLIENATGLPYAEYMSEHIFNPLGLTHTTVREETLPQNMAVGYKVWFYGSRPYTVPFSLSQAPAGSIISNGEDMEKWLNINLGLDRVSGYETVHPTGETPFHYYGGWEFDEESNQIQHGGNLENFSSYIVMDPKEKTGVVVMANLNSTYTTSIGEGIMSILHGQPASEGTLDIYLLTDQIVSSLIFLAAPLTIFMLWPAWNAVKGIRTKRRVFQAGPLRVIISILLLSILVILYYLSIQLPTFIYPNAKWNFINDWMPNTTMYGILSFLGFLTIFTIHSFIRIMFKKQKNLNV